MTKLTNAQKFGHGDCSGAVDRPAHPTKAGINDIKRNQGPVVDRSPKDVQFQEQRDTMRPKHGQKLPQQQAAHTAESEKDKQRSIDMHLRGERDNDDLPVPPAEVRGGMRYSE
ncbi:predicted protein [Phaeodactylum tricornutum CCAP 1055/1]|jgi:hypothetical protein|uniref:Uncharacterized protein n=2 Tax=Phaeodactylum tricornutum TaxID=2850 RepID=B7G3E1_PHATC|nr:predicted protein [Phaeodactylum tricornutum CCAP 1055/1]EEC46984.1 predicted protein [Phaeodactylum tricornutum CCAP 1055/1]|eukprot:XP_002181770.1 predicted protein [Phaeodactylum tricornutum CCAP 1055/1]